MPLTDLLTSSLNPYMVWIKLGLTVLALVAIVGAGLYVRHVFNDRDRLKELSAKQAQDLVWASERYTFLAEQTQKLMEAQQKIAEAVKNVKITSNLYVDKIEAARITPPATGGSVLIPAGVPVPTVSTTTRSIFMPASSARATADPA